MLTGDLMESVISYMGDSYPEEWIATLERSESAGFRHASCQGTGSSSTARTTSPRSSATCGRTSTR